MRKISIVAVLGLVLALGIYSVIADTTTTVTNRGEVLSVKTLGNTATDAADLNVYQDKSSYPLAAGQAGRIVRFYDFDKQGGAAGTTINLVPAIPVKSGTIVKSGYIHVMEAIAPVATVTNSLTINSAGDLLASGTNVCGAAGLNVALIPDLATLADWKTCTADRYVTMTIGATPITAGKIMVVLDVDRQP